MAKISYHKERDIINQEKLSELLTQLPDYVPDFFIAIENNSSTLTRLNYGYDLRLFFEYLAEKLNKNIMDITLEELNEIKARDVERFLSHISYYEKDGKVFVNKERGKARKLSALRSFFKFLFNADLISSNVITKISTPKIHQKEIIRLEVDEVVKLLNQAENPTNLTKREQGYNKITKDRDLAIMSVFLGTGIRISELVGLNIDDIDFNNNSFKIVRKGGNEVVLYFSDEVKEALFSSIQFDIEGRRVLDLFAGSGQLGIEALSRGAESAVFVSSSGMTSRAHITVNSCIFSVFRCVITSK